MPPPPIPATNRASARISIVGAKPHSAVPTVNSTSACWYERRMPIMSHSLPYSGVKVTLLQRYAVPIHASLSKAWSSDAIVGIHVATTAG